LGTFFDTLPPLFRPFPVGRFGIGIRGVLIYILLASLGHFPTPLPPGLGSVFDVSRIVPPGTGRTPPIPGVRPWGWGVGPPGMGGSDPGMGGRTPRVGGSDPGMGGSDPGDGGSDPGDGGYDPPVPGGSERSDPPHPGVPKKVALFCRSLFDR